jgi:3-oxoacyl-[acyl-carrier protein] reductase
MSTPLAGRVAIVTGVSRTQGIGAAIVRRLAADGARVLATGWTAHDAEMPWGEDPAGGAALFAGDARVVWRSEDLEQAEAPRRIAAAARERFGRVDILVANHARSSAQSLRDVTAQELDRCFAVNARATVLLAQAVASARPPEPGGRILLFTSGQHLGPMAGELPYAISKGAVHQMTASLADALAERGFTVNCINPGPVDTGWAPPELHARIARQFPGGRWGQPEDAARLVAWLASDDAAWITGQVINSEGGVRR